MSKTTHTQDSAVGLSANERSDSPSDAAVPATAELLATAYHEAGHAVMAMILGRNIQKVTIKPGQVQTGGVRLGVCELGPGRSRSSQDLIEDEVMILLAGMVAESKFTGQYCERGAAQDLRYVAAMLRDRGGSEPQMQRLQRRILDKTEHILHDPAHCRAIGQVATELIQRTTISGRSVRHIVSQAVAKNR
jgi:hypothetical protein